MNWVTDIKGDVFCVDINYENCDVDFLLHEHNNSINIAYMYTSFLKNHVYIHDLISFDEKKGHASILFDTLIESLLCYYSKDDRSCMYINGWLSEEDRKKGNWLKSIPFYNKMYINHSNVFSDLYFYNHYDKTQSYSSDYILKNINDFDRIVLDFRFVLM